MSRTKLGVALFLSAAALTGAACGSDDDPAEPEAGAQQTEEQDAARPARGFTGNPARRENQAVCDVRLVFDPGEEGFPPPPGRELMPFGDAQLVGRDAAGGYWSNCPDTAKECAEIGGEWLPPRNQPEHCWVEPRRN